MIIIDYIECYVIGIFVGDIVELNLMEMFFSKYNYFFLFGLVKLNLGYLFIIVGIVSLIKVFLSMNKDIIFFIIKINEFLMLK